MAAVDYDVGRRDLGSLYTNLMNALRNRGDAENKRKAEDIERQGLFGTGIKSGDLQDLAKTGMGFVEFGEGRKERKMSRATKSFDARMNQAKERIIELRRFGDDDSINEIRAIQAGMNEERNRFENLMSDYEELGVWESGLGSKGVGYKDTGELSKSMKEYMKRGKKTGGGDVFDRWGDRADAFAQDEASYDYDDMSSGIYGESRDFERSKSQPGTYGDPIPTHGLRRKRRRDLSGIGKDEAPLGSGMMRGITLGGREGRGYPEERQREYENIAGWDGVDADKDRPSETFKADLSNLGGEYEDPEEQFRRRWRGL